MNYVQIEQACSAWLADVAAACNQHGSKLLQLCNSAHSLLDAEKAVQLAIAQWTVSSAAGPGSAAATAADTSAALDVQTDSDQGAAAGGISRPGSASASRLGRSGSSGAALAASAAANKGSSSPRALAGRAANEWDTTCELVLGQKLDLWQVSCCRAGGLGRQQPMQGMGGGQAGQRCCWHCRTVMAPVWRPVTWRCVHQHSSLLFAG